MFSALAVTSLLSLSTSSVAADTLSADEFIKLRCSLSGDDVYYVWEGQIFSYVKQEKPQHLLNFLGYNVGRCEKIDNEWWLITRELSYYLDPKTNEKIDSWKNPFTNEEVTVAHVANDPVNNILSDVPYSMVSSKDAVVNSDIPLFYPNPLAENETFYEYGGNVDYYEGGEFFKFYFNYDDLKDAEDKLDDVPISWTRVGQWLPWMHMGEHEGSVFYSVSGGRRKDLSGTPLWLQHDVQTRLPLYLTAPTAFNPEEPNETSDTYFIKSFDEYLAGETFPLPAPVE